MRAGKAAATAPAMAGSVGTAIPEITAAASIRAGVMAVVVTAAEVVRIETQTLARVDLFRRCFFRFIPV